MDYGFLNSRNACRILPPPEVKENTISDLVVEFILKCTNDELSILTVAEVARAFDVSVSFLSRKFALDKNFTLGKFIFRERMFRSAQMLVDNTELTVKELADIMGFFDYNYFIKAFKRYFGVSPSRYRICKN